MKNITLIITVLILTASQGCNYFVNKMAFHPDTQNVLSTNELPSHVQEIFIETADKIKIQSYFIPSKNSDKVIIYFHGNAGNLCHRLIDLMQINSFGINVLGASYRGYGKSQGKPSEKGIYLDGEAAFQYAVQNLGFAPDNVIILGRSIGTTVAVNTAQNKNIGGLILVSPLTSGADHAKKTGLGAIASLAGNSFNNMEKIDNISCPILVIHGTNDSVIPFTMGKELYERIKTKKEFIKIEGAGHNNLSSEYKTNYWPPIHDFVKQFL